MATRMSWAMLSAVFALTSFSLAGETHAKPSDRREKAVAHSLGSQQYAIETLPNAAGAPAAPQISTTDEALQSLGGAAPVAPSVAPTVVISDMVSEAAPTEAAASPRFSWAGLKSRLSVAKARVLAAIRSRRTGEGDVEAAKPGSAQFAIEQMPPAPGLPQLQSMPPLPRRPLPVEAAVLSAPQAPAPIVSEPVLRPAAPAEPAPAAAPAAPASAPELTDAMRQELAEAQARGDVRRATVLRDRVGGVTVPLPEVRTPQQAQAQPEPAPTPFKVVSVPIPQDPILTPPAASARPNPRMDRFRKRLNRSSESGFRR